MAQAGIALPTREECEQLWDRYHTPLHIREHMKQVNRVAAYLARRLKECGIDVMIDLVDRASLLHDTVRITEWETFDPSELPFEPSVEDLEAWEQQRREFPPSIPHAEVNRRIFEGDYPEMAEVISKHAISEVFDLSSWEEKIVHYADRRVAHDKIVTVAERLREGEARAAERGLQPLPRYGGIMKATNDLEQEIFSILGEDPDTIRERL